MLMKLKALHIDALLIMITCDTTFTFDFPHAVVKYKILVKKSIDSGTSIMVAKQDLTQKWY